MRRPRDCVHSGFGEKHYRQLPQRLAAPLIRELLDSFRKGQIHPSHAAERLGLGRTRFYQLYADYLRACARRQDASWTPGRSGGDRSTTWPPEVEPLMRRLLQVRPPAPYRCGASEVLRRLNFPLDPATVRRWALAQGLAHDRPKTRPSAAPRRWQCLKLGALWLLDATPHPWFQHHHPGFYHACERLQKLAETLGVADLKAQVSRWKRLLLRDRIATVIAQAQALRPFATGIPDPVQEHLGFLQRHQARMQYGSYRKNGWFIGSGVIEGGCKTVVGARLKQSGMFWSEPGAAAVLNFHTLLLSHRFDAFWSARANSHAARNDILSLAA